MELPSTTSEEPSATTEPRNIRIRNAYERLKNVQSTGVSSHTGKPTTPSPSCNDKAANSTAKNKSESDERKSRKPSGDAPGADLSQSLPPASSTTQPSSDKATRTSPPAPLSIDDKKRIVLNIEMETPNPEDFIPTPESAPLVVNMEDFEPAARRGDHAARDFVTDVVRIAAYADASYRNRSPGIGATYKIPGRTRNWVDDTAAAADVYDNHEAELVAIYFVLRKLYDDAIKTIKEQRSSCKTTVPLFIIIFSDSRAALRYVKQHFLGVKMKTKSKIFVEQHIQSEMKRIISELIQMGCKIEMNCVPGHVGVRGNVRSNELALMGSHYRQRLDMIRIRNPNLIYPVSDLLRHGTPKSLAALATGSKSNNTETTRPCDADHIQHHIKNLLHASGAESRYLSKLDRLIKGEDPEDVFTYHPHEEKKRKRPVPEDEGDRGGSYKKARVR
ncbi:hypothetical protein GGR57DRAFT_518484 [Xylariaceae sp. FL1272]|nr:hypothetical protein GGR57DRAFT_518484 [Xylariaceae sp. FL1272]